jgi:hypothetical protein
MNIPGGGLWNSEVLQEKAIVTGMQWAECKVENKIWTIRGKLASISKGPLDVIEEVRKPLGGLNRGGQNSTAAVEDFVGSVS